MDALSVILIGALVSGVTEGLKRIFPLVDPKVWVAALALIGGTIYGVVVPLLPVQVIEMAGAAFASAVAIYEVLSSFYKK